MAHEQKDGGGSLFPNDKRGNDFAPDLTGKFLLGGEWYRIAAWDKTSKNGGRFLSLKVEPQGQGTSQRIEREVQSKGFPDAKAGPVRKGSYEIGSGGPIPGLDDEVPFAPEFR